MKNDIMKLRPISINMGCYKNFVDSIQTSVQFGKIKWEKKCLICGTEISDERIKATQVRTGRLRFLLRSKSEGSKTASELLYNILKTKEYHGGRDIPEDDPDWWNEAAMQIYLELNEAARSRVQVELTESGKNWFKEHYPKGIFWEYDPDKPFKLNSVTAEFIELTYLGIPYRIPPDVDGKPTVKKASANLK